MQRCLTLLQVDDVTVTLDTLTLPPPTDNLRIEWNPASRQPVAQLIRNGSSVSSRAIYSDVLRVISGHDVSERGWPALKGDAVLFLDLSLEVKDFDQYDGEVQGILGVELASDLGKARQGFHLLRAALLNDTWRGVIVIMSSVLGIGFANQGMKAVLRSCGGKDTGELGDPTPRVRVVCKPGTLAPEHQGGQTVLDAGVHAYLELFPVQEKPELRRRLWPRGPDDWWIRPQQAWMASTEKWFSRDAPDVPPHKMDDPPEKGRLGGWESRDRIEGYLHNLLGFRPPVHWLSPAELRVLWEELQGLIGKPARSQRPDGGALLTLGGAFLVAAAGLGSLAEDLMAQHHWTRLTDPVLPRQKTVDASEAIVAWGMLFEAIALHSARKQSSSDS